MSYLYIFLFILAASLIISGFKTLRYISSAKKEHKNELFILIKKWYGSAVEDQAQATGKEKKIDSLFETKIHKTSLLHFDEKFISSYLASAGIVCGLSSEKGEFERITRTGLAKSRQSLKIVSLAFGHKFTLDNYSFYNYWLILKGNNHLWRQKKTDPEGRTYNLNDVEEPYKVLEYYFNQENS
jgi:hypothetical protein